MRDKRAHEPRIAVYKGSIMQDRQALALCFAQAALDAGAKIMQIYHADFAVNQKADKSVVTEADVAAEAILIAAVKSALPDTPIIAEEAMAAGEQPDIGSRFVLIDPLDGTREFVNRNGQFTVNIALVEDRKPSVGAVYAPAKSELFIAGEGAHMAIVEPGGNVNGAEWRTIQTRAYPKNGLTAVASRSHLDADTQAFLDTRGIEDRISAGSSMKFCLLAQGLADVYPRFGRTMEWDLAAGQAVLQAAGGQVTNPDGTPFLYAKVDRTDDVDFANGAFIAWGRAALV